MNPADLLSKHWGFAEAWPQLHPILFWMGDTNVSGDGVAVKESKDTSKRNDGECHNGEPVPPKAMRMERE
jgi:hypothetical protein